MRRRACSYGALAVLIGIKKSRGDGQVLRIGASIPANSGSLEAYGAQHHRQRASRNIVMHLKCRNRRGRAS